MSSAARAKFNPSASVALNEFTPTIFPSADRRGPPELPGFMGVCVWITVARCGPHGIHLPPCQCRWGKLSFSLIGRPSGRPCLLGIGVDKAAGLFVGPALGNGIGRPRRLAS
jgi:hypothetical protein